MENITGKAANFMNINPWTQFFDLKGRTDMPRSQCRNITVRDCRFECDTYFNVKADEEHYHLSDFTLEDLDITAAQTECRKEAVENIRISGVNVTRKDTIDYPDSVTTVGEDNTIR